MRRADAREDGRAQRRARNHAAIVQATYDLIRTTHALPSMEAVALAAGVGIRTVFRQFQDQESLYRSVTDRVLEEVMALVTMTPPTGELATDLAALVERRARIFEHVTPFRRVGRLVRHQSTLLQERDAASAQVLRAALEAVLEPHLYSASDGDSDAPELLEALDAILSFEMWDRLRDQQGLGSKRAARVVLAAASRLFRPAVKRR